MPSDLYHIGEQQLVMGLAVPAVPPPHFKLWPVILSICAGFPSKRPNTPKMLSAISSSIILRPLPDFPNDGCPPSKIVQPEALYPICQHFE